MAHKKSKVLPHLTAEAVKEKLKETIGFWRVQSKRQETPIFTRESEAVIMSRKDVRYDEQREGISFKGVPILEGTHRSMAGEWKNTIRVLSAA